MVIHQYNFVVKLKYAKKNYLNFHYAAWVHDTQVPGTRVISTALIYVWITTSIKHEIIVIFLHQNVVQRI